MPTSIELGLDSEITYTVPARQRQRLYAFVTDSDSGLLGLLGLFYEVLRFQTQSRFYTAASMLAQALR